MLYEHVCNMNNFITPSTLTHTMWCCKPNYSMNHCIHIYDRINMFTQKFEYLNLFHHRIRKIVQIVYNASYVFRNIFYFFIYFHKKTLLFGKCRITVVIRKVHLSKNK